MRKGVWLHRDGWYVMMGSLGVTRQYGALITEYRICQALEARLRCEIYNGGRAR